jgi:hypothetical protein
VLYYRYMADTFRDVADASPPEPAATPGPAPQPGPRADAGRTALDLLAERAAHGSSESGADIRKLLREAAFRALI